MEKKIIYTVMRIEEKEECGRKIQNAHTYTFQSSNFERVHEYAKRIKKSYPWAKVVVIDRDKAKEIEKKRLAFYKKQQAKRMACCEEKSKDILIRQTIYSEFIKK